MTDLEYAVKTLIEAVKTGDMQAFGMLCDLFGVKSSIDQSEFLKTQKELKDSIMCSLGLPKHLLE